MYKNDSNHMCTTFTLVTISISIKDLTNVQTDHAKLQNFVIHLDKDATALPLLSFQS